MYSIVKRFLDFTGALALIILTAPLLLAIAAAIRLTMGRPVIFRQMRPGLNERLFTCLKFRTMNHACGPEGRLLRDAERMTPLGRWLRQTSFDELPQLWNILRGDLSFVGPRPLFVRYLSHYTQEERRRHSVRPGLTGWAQIHGRNSIPFEKRLELDIYYVDHKSLWFDARIFLSTVWIVLRQQGVGADAAALDGL
jgi:lipopolysaccharide/colanic/teichoic acid biosynthesis glycosyltransferase